jgi:hypothetical protein
MLGFALALCLSAPGARLPDPARGVVLALHDRDPARRYGRDVAEIHALGARSISILMVWSTRDVRSSEVGLGATTWPQIEDAIRAARSAGLWVMVGPLLHLERRQAGEWRGALQPEDWERWFASYGEMLLALARVAEREGADALLAGSELCSAEGQEERWRELLGRVRASFRGALSYQTNWDKRKTARFLDALDFVATNAYFELAPQGPAQRPDLRGLAAAWRPIREELVAWAGEWRRPLVISEIGYPSLHGALAAPWDYTREAPLDLEEQRLGYAAFFRAWRDEPALRGAFLYEWWGEGGPRDRGYTPRGKPAAGPLREWLAAGDTRP